MTPLLIAIASQLLDIGITAATKHPEYAPHLGPVLINSMVLLSQAVGETPEQTAARRAAAEAIFAKQAEPIVAPAPPVTS